MSQEVLQALTTAYALVEGLIGDWHPGAQAAVAGLVALFVYGATSFTARTALVGVRLLGRGARFVGGRALGDHLPVRDPVRTILDEMASAARWRYRPAGADHKTAEAVSRRVDGLSVGIGSLCVEGQDEYRHLNRHERRLFNRAATGLVRALGDDYDRSRAADAGRVLQLIAADLDNTKKSPG